jgi:methyl-accepting chemotaxis protein
MFTRHLNDTGCLDKGRYGIIMADNRITDKDFETGERHVVSLKFRITLFFIMFFMAIIGVFIITSVLQVSAVTRFVCTRLALPLVNQMTDLIDGDAFEALSKSLDPLDPYYRETQRKMLEIKTRGNCLYLYTMAPVNADIARYIIDGSAPPEDERNFSPIGTEEAISDEAFIRVMRTNTIQWGSINRTEEFGDLMTVYAPILNSSGELVGIIGCDLEADAIVEWIQTQVLWQLGVVAVFVILGLGVYLSLIKNLNSLIKRINVPVETRR